MSNSMMHALDESGEALLRVGHHAQERVMRFWDGFANFALRDNVLEVAVGLIIASAFTKVVSSFVSDIILPIISLLPFLNRNLEEKFTVLRPGQSQASEDYNTVAQALADGAVVLAWGTFVNNLVSLFTVGFVLYLVGMTYSRFSSESIIKRQIKCRYCRKYISEKALRCVNCGSWQDGREDIVS